MADKTKKKKSTPVDGESKTAPEGETVSEEKAKAGFVELPPKHTPERVAKDDGTLASMTAELDAFEAQYGPVTVSVADSVAAGNCESGVIAWRKKNIGGDGTQKVSAREMLEVAATGRDQISRVMLGIRRAMRRMSGG